MDPAFEVDHSRNAGRTDLSLTASRGDGVMHGMAAAPETSHTPDVSAVICVETDALDRLGSVLRHLSVGLVDQAIPLRIVGSDGRIRPLCLGPVQAVVHPTLRWPTAGRRIEHLLDVLSPQPATVVHAISHTSYRVAAAIAEEFDADLVLQVASLADCEHVAAGAWRTPVHCHAYSQPLAAQLESLGAVSQERIEVIRPGVPAGTRPACFSQPQRVPTLLCTSRLFRSSGVERLIGAVDLLAGRGHELQLFLVADGPFEAVLRRQVRARRLSACVTFARGMEDPMPALAGADLFIRPAPESEFRADLLQAMAAGVAVVTMPNAACDHFRPGETAMVCAQTTPESLADVIEALLHDRAEAARIASGGMEHVRLHHGVSAMAERTAAAYRKLALARTTFAMRG
jgi:glycosyltransferase involved in cell wall biosynthesis